MIKLGRVLSRVLARTVLGAAFLVLFGLSIGQSVTFGATVSVPAVTRSLRVADPLAAEQTVATSSSPGGPSIVGDEPQLPNTFGDDDRLDELWTQCSDGWGYACDRLFEEAPLGTDYEQFGVSCGDRPLVLHCQIELDERPTDLETYVWPLPHALPDADWFGPEPGTGPSSGHR